MAQDQDEEIENDDPNRVQSGVSDSVDNLHITKMSPLQVELVLLEIPTALAKHNKQYFANRRRQLEEQAKLDKIIAEFYEAKWSDRGKKWAKTDIEIAIKGDAKYVKQKAIVDKYSLGCEYHKESMDRINQSSMNLRTYVQFQVFLAGDRPL